MSTPETTNGHVPHGPRFCAECGSGLGGGRFCAGCGSPVAAAPQAVTQVEHQQAVRDPFVAPDAPTSTWAAQGPVVGAPTAHEAWSAHEPSTAVHDGPTMVPPPGAGHPSATPAAPRRRPWLPIALAVAAILIVGGVLAALLLGGSGNDAATPTPSSADAYRAKLTAAVTPVLRENRGVSSQLGRLRGTKVTNAKADVADARRQTTLAQGAAGALKPPAGSAQIGIAAAQVLDREEAYLSAVAAVLRNPRSSSVNELRSLQSDLTSSMIAAGAPFAAAADDVTGAGDVVSWAAHTKRVLDRRARARRAKKRTTNTTTQAPASAGSAPVSTRACDQNIRAGGATTCGFAANVFWSYWNSGNSSSLSVWSSTTSRYYGVSCSGGSLVTCTTTTNGLVTFPISAVNAYSQSQADRYAATHDVG